MKELSLQLKRSFLNTELKKCKIICQGGVLKVWYKLQVQWKIRTGKAVRAMEACRKGEGGIWNACWAGYQQTSPPSLLTQISLLPPLPTHP